MAGPDALHRALGAVLTDREWRAFCDAWLAIGLAAELCRVTKQEPHSLLRRIGRVRYKPLPKGRDYEPKG